MAEAETFRDGVRDRLIEAFGDPMVLKTPQGDIYRWVLERPHGVSVFVTLDSPEIHHVAHIMVSDPKSGIVDPFQSIVVRTIEDMGPLIEQIRRQWRGEPHTG